MKLLKIIKEYFCPDRPTLEEMYLSYAVSIEDVERRLRQIDRGDAPYQKFQGE